MLMRYGDTCTGLCVVTSFYRTFHDASLCLSQCVLLCPSPCTPFLLQNVLATGELFWLSSEEVEFVNQNFGNSIHHVPAVMVRSMPPQWLKTDFQIRNQSFGKALFLCRCWNLYWVFCQSVLSIDLSNRSFIVTVTSVYHITSLSFWCLWWLKF